MTLWLLSWKSILHFFSWTKRPNYLVIRWAIQGQQAIQGHLGTLYFFWDHWAHSGYFEKLNTTEADTRGLCSFTNCIAAYEENYTDSNFLSFVCSLFLSWPWWLSRMHVQLVIWLSFRLDPYCIWQHSFIEIDFEILSMVILSCLLIQEEQLSVSAERIYTNTGYLLKGLSLPRKSMVR